MYRPVSKYLNVRLSFVDLRWAQLNFSLVFVTFFKLMFGSDLEHRVWSRFWNWNLANILRLVLTWDLTIFGNTIGNKDRGEVIPRTWFHSFFSRKKSEIRIAFTFFEKWKVKNKIPSLFFEKWKWNWSGSRSQTRSENEKKILRILENFAGLCWTKTERQKEKLDTRTEKRKWPTTKWDELKWTKICETERGTTERLRER